MVEHKHSHQCSPQHLCGEHQLTFKDIHVHYGDVCALRDVSFDISCEHALALVGGNGAGKSTLLKSIVGLVPISSGSVTWRGEPVQNATYEIAYLSQRDSLNYDFPITVEGLVEMGRFEQTGLLGSFSKKDREVVEFAMESMKIIDLRDRQFGALSGGQQQRVFIAQALAQEAHVLLLDEPFTGLDVPSQELLSELLKKLVKEGCLIIASHHDVKTAKHLFDKVLLLNKRVVDYGSVNEVLTDENLKKAFGQ